MNLKFNNDIVYSGFNGVDIKKKNHRNTVTYTSKRTKYIMLYLERLKLGRLPFNRVWSIRSYEKTC